MNVDGSGLRALTTNGRDSFPAWSPDGKQIAFIRPTASGWRLHVMSASGAGERQLRQAPPAGRPSWTNRGLLIPTNGDLAKIDPRSGHVQKLFGALIDASVGMNATAVSPDLSTITFVGARPRGSRGPWLRRGRALSDVRALHPGSSHAQGAASSRYAMADRRRSRPTESASRSWLGIGSFSRLSRTARRSRSRPGSSHRRRALLRSGSRAEL